MTKKKIITLTVLVLGIITPVIALGISFLVASSVSQQNIPEQISRESVSERSSAQADAPSKAIFQPENIRGESANAFPKTILEINSTRYEGEITAPDTVYGFMKKMREDGKINFTDKTYIGMGKFIDTIGGIRADGERTWIYYVNGKKAEVGVSNYKIKPGDVVSWKYEKLLAY